MKYLSLNRLEFIMEIVIDRPLYDRPPNVDSCTCVSRTLNTCILSFIQGVSDSYMTSYTEKYLCPLLVLRL